MKKRINPNKMKTHYTTSRQLLLIELSSTGGRKFVYKSLYLVLYIEICGNFIFGMETDEY